MTDQQGTDERGAPRASGGDAEGAERKRTGRRSARRRGAGEGHVMRRSDGLWRGALMVGRQLDGRPDYRFVYAKTRTECVAKLDELRRSAQGAPLPPASPVKVGEFFERWLRDSVRPSVRPRTYDSYLLEARKHIIPALGTHRLTSLRPETLQRYYAAELEAGLSSTSVKYHHAIVRRALKQAVRWGLVARNVAEAVDPPRVQREEMRFLTPGEVGALLATAEAGGDRLAALWALAVYTGARQGELLALRWSDVDLDAGALTVSRALERIRGGAGVYAEPKTATSLRSLTVEADAVALLRAHRERQFEEKRAAGGAYADEGLIFCTQLGRPLTAST